MKKVVRVGLLALVSLSLMTNGVYPLSFTRGWSHAAAHSCTNLNAGFHAHVHAASAAQTTAHSRR